MVQEIKQDKEEKQKIEERNQEAKSDEKKQESKIEEKKTEKKKEQKKVVREFALVKGLNLHISVKKGLHICDMIRGKKVDDAIKMTEEVGVLRRVVKMHNREVPHQHGKGIMGGAYPVNASKEFVKLLKQLKANAIYHGIDIEKAVLTLCKTDQASKPFKRGGARAKRAHVVLRLEIKKEAKK